MLDDGNLNQPTKKTYPNQNVYWPLSWQGCPLTTQSSSVRCTAAAMAVMKLPGTAQACKLGKDTKHLASFSLKKFYFEIRKQ